MKEDLLKIINHYGVNKQLKYIHTEYFELDDAIVRYESYGKFDEDAGRTLEENIAEEIADIMVMLKQFQYYYEITDEELEDDMKFKIKRQLERIEEEECTKKV